MGMIESLWSKVNRLEDAAEAGGMGRIGEELIVCSVSKGETPDISLGGLGLTHKSDIVITKEEVSTVKFSIEVTAAGSNTAYPDQLFENPIIFEEPLFDDFGANALLWVQLSKTCVMMFAYKTGEFTFTLLGESFTVNIPATGIYVAIPNDTDTALVNKIELSIRRKAILTIDPKFLPEGVGGSLPSPQVNLLDYGIAYADFLRSTVTIPQGEALWNKMLAIKNAGIAPEVQVFADGIGQGAYVSAWQYQGGVPAACACVGKTVHLGDMSIQELYMILMYDPATGTVTAVHNLN